jgi:RPA family protein
MKRETAWRVFAGEYNDSTYEIKGEGEMAPSYIVTPLGAKVNRVFVIGVLTDVENVSEGGDLVRARISDPTGVFTMYSGSYQEDVTEILNKIEVPAFVAVVGKVRTYVPEEGSLYVSIRPEKILEVTANDRDKWILETCKNTKDRIEAVVEAMKLENLSEFDLKKLGFSKELCEGIIAARGHYGKVDLEKYIRLIHESLQYLTPGKESLPDLKQKEDTSQEKIEEPEIKEEPLEEPQVVTADKVETPKEEKKEEPAEKEESDGSLETEETVLDIIKEIEGENGAQWDTITEKCEKKGLDQDNVEEALTSLMDKGLIYEPVLGTIKST